MKGGSCSQPAAAAYATGTGVITVRKAGKLPREVYREDYSLE